MSRRSSRLSKQTARPIRHEEVKFEKLYGEMSDVDSMSVSSVDEDEYSARRGKRPKKASRSKGAKRQKITGPSRLENVPIDIFFEILAYLRPLDMLILARTNHTFRNHLMSRKAQTFWKHARAIVGAPDPPPNCSEPKWANLLFGGSKCQHCGTPGVLRVDFGLCRRLCTKCLKDNLVVHSKFSRRFPDYDAKVLDLIPYTNVGGWSSGHATGSRFYWEDDVHAMHEKLIVLRKDVNMRQPDAEANLDAFVRDTTENIIKTQEMAGASKRWLREALISKSQEKQSWEDRRKTEIKDAFVQMGYKQEDVNCALQYIPISANNQAMSPGVWTRSRKKYEPLVIAARHKRLHSARSAALKPAFDDWIKTMKPMQWIHLPPFWVISHDPVVTEAFHSSTGDIENPTPEQYAHLARGFPDIAARWEDHMSTDLNEMFERACQIQLNEPDQMFERASQAQTNGSSWARKDLVVIRCSFCQEICIGTKEWAGHPWSCMSHGYRPLRYISSLQSKHVKVLVELLGKNPQETTVEQLDVLNPRFFCISCNKGPNKYAYTWRQFINHTYGLGNHDASLVTNPADLEAIRQLEDSKPDMATWLCMHCSESYNCPKSLSAVKEHLLQVHDIQAPTEHCDLMWDFTRISYRYRCTNAVNIETQPVSPVEGEAVCLHCPHKEVFDSVEYIRTHLMTQHRSKLFGREILLGKDFEKLDS